MPVDVVSVEALEPYRLRLEFDDGLEGEIDLDELITFDGVFASLREHRLFAQVRVDPDLGTIVWPNGADLDALVLHAAIKPRNE